MTRTVSEADLQALFHSVMQRHQLRVQEIKDLRKAVVVVHGYGQFECDQCAKQWWSFFSWIRLDLRDMMIQKKWQMKCERCLIEQKPTFSLEETEKMVEKAIYAYLGKKFVPTREPGDHQGRRLYRPPHKPHLCEKCGWGQVQCWTLPPYSLFVKA